MKKLKNLYKKHKKALAIVLIGILIVNTSMIYADENNEWTDKKQEEAWAVYFMTEWKNFDLNVDGNGNISYINKKLEKSGNGYWLSCMEYFYNLAQPNMKTGEFDGAQDPNSFKNLLLAMSGALGDADDNVDYEKDVEKYDLSTMGKNILRLADYSENRLDFRNFTSVDGNIYNYDYTKHSNVNETASVFTYMYNNFVRAQQLYNELYGEQVDIYQKNEALKVCIQAALYGPEYVRTNKEYSKVNAKDYYNSNEKLKKTLWNNCYNFADTTFELYSAVAATGHSVEG